jgi:methionyl-tRNA formyltransferase
MRLAFAGTPEFARVAAAALHAAGHTVALVLTQPDRPAGRGLQLQASPVKQWALSHQLPVIQARSLRLDGKYPDEAHAAQLALQQADIEAMVVAAYGLILPQWVLDLPPLGCINIHASLLPRWRGAAPIHRAIEAGDAHTGVTLMQMDAGLDTGAMLQQHSLAIAQDDTTATLHDKLAALGARMCVDWFAQTLPWPTGEAQPSEGVSYAHKIDKQEARIDWRSTAHALERRLRALTPAPGLFFMWQGEAIKVWAAQAHAPTHQAQPGTVLRADASGLWVACAQGSLQITVLQKPGGKRLGVADFLRGAATAPSAWQGLQLDQDS